MKYNTAFLIFALCLPAFSNPAKSQENVTVVAPTSEAAQGLDLVAVAELFKNARNLEEFERRLNDPETGVNNLDLNEDGNVDFIRVVEEADDDVRLIILQVPLAENEFQDVATIEAEKEDEEVRVQVHGNEELYGPSYYVAPTVVHVHVWPIFGWIWRPAYRPYRSVYYFGFYPRWWRPFHPVPVHVYRTRTVRITRTTTFRVTRTSHVTRVSRVKYKPRSSTLVKKKKVTVKHTGRGGKTTTVTAGVRKKTNKKTGKTTVTRGVKKTKTTKHGKKTTVKGKRTTKRTKGKAKKRK